MAQGYRLLVGTDLFVDSFGYLNGTTEAVRTFFSGTASPPSPVSGQPWFDTDTNTLNVRNSANDGWIPIGKVTTNLGGLPVDGGQMTGPGSGGSGIDMNTAPLTNLPLGTGLAAARQQEVDAKAPTASPVFTTDAQLATSGRSPNSLINVTFANAKYVFKVGDTMTGALNLFDNATLALHAVPKQQLDAHFNTGSGHKHDGIDSKKVIGQHIDSGGVIEGRVLTADGSGGHTYSLGATKCFGTVAKDGTTELVGSNNWSAVRNVSINSGNYTITIDSGVFASSPVCICSIFETKPPFVNPGTASVLQIVSTTATSLTVRGYRTLSGGASFPSDAAFSFIAMELGGS
jgi:hypothetical protein